MENMTAFEKVMTMDLNAISVADIDGVAAVRTFVPEKIKELLELCNEYPEEVKIRGIIVEMPSDWMVIEAPTA